MATGSPFLRRQAEALALRLLRADPAGDAGEGVVVEQRFGGEPEVALGHVLDEARDVDAHRAAVDAGGVATLEAALGLGGREQVREAEVDLREVMCPDERLLLGHPVALDGHPLPVGERRLGVLRSCGRGLVAHRAAPAVEGSRADCSRAASWTAEVCSSAGRRQALRRSRACCSKSRYVVNRSASNPKSTWCASNSGPSTQA